MLAVGRSTALASFALADGLPLERFVAAKGMRAVAEHMARSAREEAERRSLPWEVRRPCWVNSMRAERLHWRLLARGRDQGAFDAVVIAHNGKCANRLVGGSGVPQVERQLRSLKLSALWVVMAAVQRDPAGPAQPQRLEGLLVEGDPVLSWACNNSAKMGLSAAHSPLECWTLISTPEYGWSNKVPQEAVPTAVAAQVARELIERADQMLGLGVSGDGRRVAYTRAQLWGAALPLNSPGVDCIWDAEGRVGVCGDWLTGASIQSAFLSGRALARKIAASRGVSPEDHARLSEGLRAPFRPLAVSPIGEFPGSVAAPVAKPSGHRGPTGGRGRPPTRGGGGGSGGPRGRGGASGKVAQSGSQ